MNPTQNRVAAENRGARRALVLAALAVPLFALLARTLGSGAAPHVRVLTVVGLSIGFLAARLLTLRLPRGDEVAVTMIVGLFGLATSSAWEVVLAAAAAGVADAGVRSSNPGNSRFGVAMLDAVRSVAVVSLVSPWQHVLHSVHSVGQTGDSVVIWTTVAAFWYVCADMWTLALQEWGESGTPLRRGIATLWRPLGTVYLVHLSMAAVAVRLADLPGGWAFPVALLLTLILQHSFNLYMRIRRAYTETIGALARAAELDRPSDSGRSRRVCDLSIAVGRKMGLPSQELERIGYAALLHDIGKIGYPDAGGGCGYMNRGAQIVSSIPFLSDVAPLIADPPQFGDEVESPGATIVRTCSEYDAMRLELGARSALSHLADARVDSGHARLRVLDALEAIVGGQYAGNSAIE